MSDLMQWYIVCYLFQISHSYIQFYGSQVPFNNFDGRRVAVSERNSFKNRWAYQPNSQCQAIPAQFAYRNYYYPYKSFKYSYIKYAPSTFKRESIRSYPEWNQYHYPVNPSGPTLKRLDDNINYVNYIPRNNWPANYLSSYYELYNKPNAYYSQAGNGNHSHNCPLMTQILSDVYHQPQKRLPAQRFIPKTEIVNYNNETSSEPPTTHRIKKQTEFNLDIKSKNTKNEKLLYMFPSEIVIKSLGPWAQVGKNGEFSSNGTFSIRYDVSSAESTNLTNGYMKQFQNMNTVIETSTYNGVFRENTTKKYVTSSDRTGSIDSLSDEIYEKLYEEGNEHKRKRKRQMNSLHENKKSGDNSKLITRKHLKKNKKNSNISPKAHVRVNRVNNQVRRMNKTSRRRHKPMHHDNISERKIKFVKGRRNKLTDNDRSVKITLFDGTDCSTEASTVEDISRITCDDSSTIDECPTTTACPTTKTRQTTKISTIPTKTTELVVTHKTSTKRPAQMVTGSELLKQQCEIANGGKCVCSLRTLLADLDSITSKNIESNELLRNLANSSCTKYIPLQHSYKISASMKPKLISNKPKELIVDEESGPKKLEGETLEALIDRGIPSEGIDFYVFPSTNIEVPCITTNKIQLSPNTADSTKYTWAHANNKAITEGRIIEDLNHRGSLAIHGVTLEDSDNYTCTVNYTSPDTELATGSSFLHSILVVSEPILALHTLIHYKAKTVCNQEILEMFELYLPKQIERNICENDDKIKICNVEIHNPICRTNPGRASLKSSNVKKINYGISLQGTRRERRDSDEVTEECMEMSMNYQIDISDIWQLMPSTDNRSHCSPFCQQKIHLKVIETIQESIYDALVTPVESTTGIVFEPDPLTLNVKLVIACDGGLKLFQGFCVPCPKGYYSEEGKTKCTKCSPGTYQDCIGSKSCKDCPHPFKEGCIEMWLTPMMLFILAASIIILLLLCCLLFCFCRNRPANETYATKSYQVKPSATNTSPKNTKVKKQKRQKQAKYREPPKLPSEDFSA